MATYYIDPQNGSDSNSGLSPSSARQTPPSMSANDTWLFKRGTTYTPGTATAGIDVSVNGFTIGAYGDGPRPIINSANCGIGIRFQTDKTDGTVRGVRVTNTATGTNRRGIANGTTSSSGTVETRITIQDCEVDNILTSGSADCQGIELFGTGNTVTECEIHDIATDGIWFRGNDFTASYNHIYRVAQDGRVAGDCIQNSTDGSNVLITRNTLDHSDVDDKQCIIVQASSGSGVISYNDITGFDSTSHTPIYVDSPNFDVYGNIVRNGNTCIAFLSTRDNCRAWSNVVINNTNRGIDANSPNCEVFNNTVIGDGTGVLGIRHTNASATSVVIENNIVVGFPTGISVTTNGVANYNCIFRANTSVSGASLGTNFNADPLLNTNYRPTNLRLANAGVGVSGNDLYGDPFRAQTVGAVDMGYNGFQAIQKTTDAVGNAESYMGGESKRKKRKGV